MLVVVLLCDVCFRVEFGCLVWRCVLFVACCIFDCGLGLLGLFSCGLVSVFSWLLWLCVGGCDLVSCLLVKVCPGFDFGFVWGFSGVVCCGGGGSFRLSVLICVGLFVIM